MNNPNCQFDGGDCCGFNVNTELCSQCFCYENCIGSFELIRNGFCNDETNNAKCNYDSGECCGACINTDNCTECLCHIGAEPTHDISCKQSFDILHCSECL